MDTVHLTPRLRIKMPDALRWVVVGLSFLLVAMTWWVSDLWRLATWPAHQIEMDGSMSRRQLLALSLFGLLMAACIVTTTIVALAHGWHFFEWAALTFVFTFLYGAATGNRIL